MTGNTASIECPHARRAIPATPFNVRDRRILAVRDEDERPPGANAPKLMAERDSDVLSIYVRGRLDYTAAGAFEQALSDALVETDRALILNLGEVAFMDSAGLRVILHCAKQLQVKDARLILCVPSDRLREMFTVAGLQNLLPIYENRRQVSAALPR